MCGFCDLRSLTFRAVITPQVVLTQWLQILSNGNDRRTCGIERKRLDLIVANDVSGDVFGSDSNEVTLLFADGRQESIARMSKAGVAERVLDAVVALLGH